MCMQFIIVVFYDELITSTVFYDELITNKVL